MYYKRMCKNEQKMFDSFFPTQFSVTKINNSFTLGSSNYNPRSKTSEQNLELCRSTVFLDINTIIPFPLKLCISKNTTPTKFLYRKLFC